MENETLLWIAGTVITVLITYHVAWRQGAFRRPSPQVVIGFPTEDVNDVWAVIVPVIKLPVSHYVTVVPIGITNSSGEPLHQSHVQITTHRELIALQLREAAPDLYEQLTRDSDAKSHYLLGDKAVADYTMATIPPGGGIVIGHAVVCPSSALERDSGVLISRLSWQLTAANAKKSTGAGYVIFVKTASAYDDQTEASRVAEALVKQARRDGALRTRYLVWRWRAANKPLESRSAMVIHVKWLHVKPSIGLDDSLWSRNISKYRIDELDLVFRPGVPKT